MEPSEVRTLLPGQEVVPAPILQRPKYARVREVLSGEVRIQRSWGTVVTVTVNGEPLTCLVDIPLPLPRSWFELAQPEVQAESA